MMRISVMTAVLLLAILPFASAGEEALQVGDPLDIYVRYSPVQNITFLNLHPSFNATASDRPEYIINLGAKGSGRDKVVAFLPTSDEDNSLKYEANSSVNGMYNFSVLGRAVKDTPDARYRIKVTVEIDYRRSGSFRSDREFSFIIEGVDDSKLHRKVGAIGITSEDLKEMDRTDGGRIRMTIARDDHELNTVALYVGYRDSDCSMTLPMSRASPKEGSDGSGSMVLIILLVLLIVGAALAYFIIDRVSKRNEPAGKARKKGRGR